MQTMTRKTALKLANASFDSEKLQSLLLQLFPKDGKRGSWAWAAHKLLRWMRNPSQPLPFKVFVKGNSKLPFYAFSALPLVTCPGAGSCKKFCYSLRAWRYPAAFFRQILNTVLLSTPEGRERIGKAFDALPLGVTVRLYVDGDIHSETVLGFWFSQCVKRSDLSVYGYSKSWDIFLNWKGEFPSNYRLNLSSGSLYGKAKREAMARLPIVRGEFLAVPVQSVAPKRNPLNGEPLDMDAWNLHRAEVSQKAKELGHSKVFVCPGLCAFCLHGKHACGSDKLKGVAIAIGIH